MGSKNIGILIFGYWVLFPSNWHQCVDLAQLSRVCLFTVSADAHSGKWPLSGHVSNGAPQTPTPGCSGSVRDLILPSLGSPSYDTKLTSKKTPTTDSETCEVINKETSLLVISVWFSLDLWHSGSGINSFCLGAAVHTDDYSPLSSTVTFNYSITEDLKFHFPSTHTKKYLEFMKNY